MRVTQFPRIRTHRLFSLVLSGMLVMSLSQQTVHAQDTMEPDTLLSPAQWKNFESNVKDGIRSSNQGVMESSLGQIATFGEYMSFDQDDVIRVVRIYRENGVFRIRQQAVTAIGKMNSRWGIEFLDMLANTETSEQLRQTMRQVVDSYWSTRGGNPYRGN